MSTLSIAYYFNYHRMKVTKQTVTDDGKMTYIEIEPDQRFNPVCHVCKGTNTAIHCWESRDIRDLPLAEAETWLKYTYRKVYCKDCHNNITEVLNYETGEIVWMGPDRKAATLEAFYNELSDEQRKSIEAIAMDMWDPYIKATKNCLPHVEIVFDLFHVVAAFGRVIDRIRMGEFNRAGLEYKELFKGSKYLLLKNLGSIRSNEQRQRLAQLCSANEIINRVLILRDQLKHLWRYVRPGCAQRALSI